MPTPALLSPANASRWAAAPAILMGLANVPAPFQAEDFDLPTGVLWLSCLLGVAGLVAAAALLRRHPAGPVATLVVAAVNAVGALIVLLQGDGAGAVGLVLGLSTIALLLVPAWFRTRRNRSAVAAPA